MNEFTLGIYHFKGSRFPLALSAFTWKTNRVERGDGVYLTSTSTPGLGNEKQTKEKGQVCLLPSVPREKASCVHVQSLFYFASYRCESSTAFFAQYRQDNNREARRTRLIFFISFIDSIARKVRFAFISSR